MSSSDNSANQDYKQVDNYILEINRKVDMGFNITKKVEISLKI